jgi:hypothetical protein
MSGPTDQTGKPSASGKPSTSSKPKAAHHEGDGSFHPPPRMVPSFVEKAMAKAEELPDPEFVPPPPPPRIPFLSDLITLWGVKAIAACLLLSAGMFFTAMGDLYCLWLFSQGMGIAARCFALPLFFISVLVYSYASACFLAILTGTATGYDKIDDWPTGLWKDWFWTLPSTVGMLAAAIMLGSFIGGFLMPTSWRPTIIITFFVYPILQFSVVENGSLMNPVSVPVWRSFRTVWWAWLIFYAVTAAGVILFYVVIRLSMLISPVAGVAAGSILECACFFLYARLLGRLAWCALKYGDL